MAERFLELLYGRFREEDSEKDKEGKLIKITDRIYAKSGVYLHFRKLISKWKEIMPLLERFVRETGETVVFTGWIELGVFGRYIFAKDFRKKRIYVAVEPLDKQLSALETERLRTGYLVCSLYHEHLHDILDENVPELMRIVDDAMEKGGYEIILLLDLFIDQKVPEFVPRDLRTIAIETERRLAHEGIKRSIKSLDKEPTSFELVRLITNAVYLNKKKWLLSLLRDLLERRKLGALRKEDLELLKNFIELVEKIKGCEMQDLPELIRSAIPLIFEIKFRIYGLRFFGS